MRLSYLVLSLPALCNYAVSAQGINLNSIVSEVYSVYTQVTSIWESDASVASVQATATDSSTTNSGSSVTSSTSARSSASNAIAQNSSSQTASAKATSASSLASSSHGTNHKTLAIVLGCVLGALLLGLLILAFLLCCRRRNRKDRSNRNVRSPDDDEMESWRNGGSGDSRVAGVGGSLPGHHHNRDGMGAVVGPNMTEHPAYRNQNHDNPFVPTPPPARRTAPTSRAGLTDEARPGEQPYLTDPKTSNPLNSGGASNDIHKNDHHKAEAIAAGLGGAGAAAALMHHRHKKEDEKLAREQGRDGIRDDGLHSHHKTTNSTDGAPTMLYSERHLGDAGGDPNVINSHHHHTGELLGGTALGGAALAGGTALHHHHDKDNGIIPPDYDGNRLQGDNAGLGHNSENRSGLAPISGGSTENRPEHDHHKGEALAATAGVGALAAAGMHHHHKKEDEKMTHERKRDLLDTSGPNDSHGQPPRTVGIHDAQQGDHDKGEALAAGLGGVGLTGAAMAHHRRENEMLGRDREDEGNLLPGDRSKNQHNLSNLPANSADINNNNNDHHQGEALAAGGLATGLVGASAVHHHQRIDDEASARNREQGLLRDNSLQHSGSITRKPVGSSWSTAPISPITPVESQHISRPFPTPTTNDDAYALNKAPSRRSGESARRLSLGRDRPAVPGNVSDVYSVPYDSTQRNLRQPDTYDGPRKSLDGGGNDRSHVPLLVGGAAGVAAGAALANHRNRKSSKSRSPHRRNFIGIGDKKRDSNSDHSTNTTNSSGSYDDAVPVQTAILAQRPLSGAETRDVTAEMPEDVPPTPPTRSRRNSALGSGAPSAAVGSYMNQSLSQQGGGNGPPLTQRPGGAVPPMPVMGSGGNGNTAYGWGNGYKNGQRVPARRDQTPPAVPSRSPRRARFSDMPLDPEEDAAMGTGRKGLVGDNGYPHMGLPSRRSGDDFESIVPVRNEGPAPGLRPSLDGERDSARDTSSEDSTWRLSSGMPGGWRKEGRTASMGSQNGKRTSGGWFSRDSGVAGLDGSRSGSMTSASGAPAGNGRRLRLSDLRREEEEKERERGRRSMGAEWSGNGGYDGYEGGGIGGGVGQAL